MDFDLEKRWKVLQDKISKEVGGGTDLQAIIFLVGVQELGKGYQKLKKDEKLAVMHIGVCTLLAPYGYYEFIGRDKEGWPHFDLIKKLPPLNDREQKSLLKRAVVEYFEENGL